jgi:broad specificity phosphatase PhoE
LSDARGQQVVSIRHGETEWSRDGRHTSHTDIPLTERGRRQAITLGDRLGGRRFARVLTSPLTRALETCRLAGYGEAAEHRRDLVEWDYGEYEGRTTIDIRRDRPGWSLWTDGAPGGETAADAGARVDGIIEEIRATPGDVAVFGHGHLLRVLAARWVDLAPAEGRALALEPASISILGFERETPVITLWNEPEAPG